MQFRKTMATTVIEKTRSMDEPHIIS